MNKIEKGKTGLIGLGVGALVLALLSLVGAVFVIIDGIRSVSVAVSVANIFEIIGGAILCIVAFLLIYVGIYFTWIGSSMKAVKGSIADDDLCKGTVNMIKCENCGSEVTSEDQVCGNCGYSLAKTVKCPACGENVDASKKFCTKCGAEIK